MATISSVNSLKIAIALAERQVQRDQSQVQEDANRLDQSQAQLVRDQRQLSSAQEQGRTAQSGPVATPQPQLERATLEAAKVQVNTQGQALGKLINTTA